MAEDRRENGSVTSKSDQVEEGVRKRCPDSLTVPVFPGRYFELTVLRTWLLGDPCSPAGHASLIKLGSSRRVVHLGHRILIGSEGRRLLVLELSVFSQNLPLLNLV